MNSFEKYLQQQGLATITIQRYNTQLLNFITWCDMQNIEAENSTSTEVTSYLQHLQKQGQQNVTRSIKLNVLKHFFDYQIETEHRQDNPAQHIKIRGAKHKTLYPILIKQELESIYHNYKVSVGKLSRQRNKAIIGLMIYQGLCTDEVNRLTVKDIKLKEGTVFITGTRKSNERTLELKPHQIMELMEYQLTVRNELQKLNPKQTELYFLPTPCYGKQTITDNDGINIWKRLSQEIRKKNKKFINFKQVRTSVITHWLKHYNLRQVQYMAGHRYVSSTESYLVNQIEDLQQDIEKYHPI